jgi:hypothetical protein
MKKFAQKLKVMFERRENREMEASKKFWGRVIVSSTRETEKFQKQSKFLRNTIFFLIAITLIVFAFYYVY